MNPIEITGEGLAIAYSEGTQRTKTPEETLKAITPKLSRCGITRVPDVTFLDNIGIPTCCAIRPTASILQVSNGKGASKISAQVSALMESIELFHAENSQYYPLRFQSAADFGPEEILVPHEELPSFRTDVYHEDTMKMQWYAGKDVLNDEKVWIPASALFFNQEPAVHTTTTNGLASGNHLIEASIHSLYELIERDAGSRLSVNGKINLSKSGGVVKNESIEDAQVRKFIELMSVESKVILCFVKSAIDVYTFWVILLNQNSLSPLTTLNIGWGTHRNKEIAASRALTEAAQSRLTNIHGAREDIIGQAGYQNSNVRNSKAFKYFNQLVPDLDWRNLPAYSEAATFNLMEDWQYLLSGLESNGHSRLYQFDLTQPGLDIPVVKMVVPSLIFKQKMF
jgi:ribosomal protein S12 methylthiotransferase accessory factor